ncbi:hypothetical protein phiST2_0074 [Vibrio phage phi-ST2]|uniref:Uncharacterized protein n=2 Tax=Schizotequatrovirus TaxID=1198137 RepID=A0A126HHB8_9CAUD|nr:hypothetical protein CF80_gp093 [Vibrio phage VH7D]ALP47261.1 hypothetical protein phiGrn1_0318 [Vibrio phage phi-Grn1]ALP47642.1 hypothetical protein phiST2_0074 [Vibrio phage phi-ST2]QNJ54893.1 hypothetical protein vBValMR10Z_353 [Vibrio phage vB_ValM_R10Z]QNJ55278.1 hypothetical protein vBValMR11Z_352 [Vibrio phage vB_ValM_R11Z]AGB06880.1 hypothetical protein [Vibrio phage VH7D]
MSDITAIVYFGSYFGVMLLIIAYYIYYEVKNNKEKTTSDFAQRVLVIGMLWPFISIFIIVIGSAIAVEKLFIMVVNKLKGR